MPRNWMSLFRGLVDYNVGPFPTDPQGGSGFQKCHLFLPELYSPEGFQHRTGFIQTSTKVPP